MPQSAQSYFSSQSLNLETMNIFHTAAEQKHMNPPRLSNKKRLNQEQVRLLERSFTTNKKLDPELKLKLANQLGVPPRQVAIWYQNKRARWRTQSLELDYNTVQVKLENALAEKRRLEKDVKQLREELRQAHEMMFSFSQKASHVTPLVSCSSTTTTAPAAAAAATTSCSDQGGGSFSLSLHHEDVINGTDNHQQLLQLDDLYACLIGAGGGSAWS